MFTGVLKKARLPAPSCEEKIKINVGIVNTCFLAMDKTDACTGRVCLDQLQVMHGLNKAVVLYLSMNVNLGVFNVLSCLSKTTTSWYVTVFDH